MATSHLSLIIPVYNRPNEVEELLDSLTRQSETNFEVVIVEDGSKETCQHVVEAFKDKLDVSYSYIPNGGPGNARNYGAKQSKGDYLIVLDSDCILPPDYIKSVNKELKETGAYINSIFPVSASAAEKEPALAKIADYNTALQEMCDGKHLGFIDNTALVQENYYEEDGIHFKAEFYPVWATNMAEVATL